MQTVPQGHRLRTWLAASIALHMLLVLFLATRKMLLESQMAQVVFQPPVKQKTQLLPAPIQQPPAPQPAPVQQQEQTSETIDFNMDLHKTTKFGYGTEVKAGDEPGGDEDSTPPEAAKQEKQLQKNTEPLPLVPTEAEGRVEGNERVEKKETAEARLAEGTNMSGGAGPRTKLARLFEGFVNYMSDPRREEMIDYHAPDKRYADYMRKVGWALQNSFQLHNKPLTLEQDIHTQVTLILEIGRDGRLMNLIMAPKTGEEMLNKHITKIVNKAAPFARLPDDFKRTCMKIRLPVYIDAQQGTHTYYLQF